MTDPVTAPLMPPLAGPAPLAVTDPAAQSAGVVIRTRDRPLFLGRALASVAAQSWSNWRIALVNDGGDPAPVTAALSTLAPDIASRIEVIHNDRSAGRSAAFNSGLARLETDFVACLDDDDTWAPDFLEALIGFWCQTRPDAPELGGVMALVQARREDIVDEDGTRQIIDMGEDWLPNAFRRRDFFVNPVAYATYRQDLYPVQWLLRREAVATLGGFPEAFDVMEDRAFMTRFLERWQLAVLDRTLAFHHRRIQRKSDTGRTVDLNTLDNPSYDWRKFAELARPQTHGTGHTDTGPDLAALMRAVGGTVIKELNDETSALWHKVNGEADALRQRLDALEARLADAPPASVPDLDPATTAWSLWPALHGVQQGHAVARGQTFADRLSLSLADEVPGLLYFADPAARRLAVQIPRTRDWAAVELSLDGLAHPGGGLRVDLTLRAETGYLFETALALRRRVGLTGHEHVFAETHVHDCPAGGTVHVRREFTSALLSGGKHPKLSIILPRHAAQFRFLCRDLVVSRI